MTHPVSDLQTVQAQVAHLIERGRLDHAERMLADAIASWPDDVGNHVLAARIELERDDPDAARESIGRALAASPADREARLLLFRICCAQRALAEAEKVILELLHESPDDSSLYALYADLMLRSLHIDRAGALAAEALRLDPGNPVARVVQVLVNIIESRRAAARAELETLVRDDPNALYVAWSIVAVLQSEHRNREAMEVMRGILQADPNDPDALDGLVALRAASHWTMLPLWPLNRFGWAGSGGLWAVAIGSLLLCRIFAPDLVGPVAGAYIVYVAYSWIWPPLLRRWLLVGGF